MEVSLENMAQFADEFVQSLPAVRADRAHVVGLSGELGSGKTTFVQHVARALGAAGGVTSPTFVFAQRYAITHPVFSSLVHIDAYRLKPEEIGALRLESFFEDPKNLVFVEWPENLSGMLDRHTPTLTFHVLDTTRRSVSYV